MARKLFAEGAQGVVVKAQIHAGGRGKGGGVKVAQTREDAELHAKNILGMTLVTHQTGPQGQKVQRLLIEETAAIDRELYLGIVLDRATGKLVFMASQAGGMEIEEVAAKTPEAIFKETIDPAVGFGAWQARKLAFALGLKPTQINAGGRRSSRASTRPSSRRTRRWWRSIPSSRRRTTSCSRSTRRSPSTTTRCSATRTSRRCATWPKRIRWKWKRASTR